MKLKWGEDWKLNDSENFAMNDSENFAGDELWFRLWIIHDELSYIGC